MQRANKRLAHREIIGDGKKKREAVRSARQLEPETSKPSIGESTVADAQVLRAPSDRTCLLESQRSSISRIPVPKLALSRAGSFKPSAHQLPRHSATREDIFPDVKFDSSSSSSTRIETNDSTSVGRINQYITPQVSDLRSQIPVRNLALSRLQNAVSFKHNAPSSSTRIDKSDTTEVKRTDPCSSAGGAAAQASTSVVSRSTVQPASQNGRLSAVNFAAKNLYDVSTGIPKSRDECEMAVAKLSKNPLPLDYYSFLDLAQTHHGHDVDIEQLYLAMATVAISTNRVLQKRIPDEEPAQPGIIPNRGFSVEEASKTNDVCLLPTNKSFRLSDWLRRGEESNWTSTAFDAHTRAIVLRIAGRLRDVDNYFPCYTGAPQSSKYLPLGDDFFETFSAFIIVGFGQPETRTLACRVRRLLRETIENFQDRCRKDIRERHGPGSPEELLLEAKGELQSGLLPHIRLNPPF